MPLDADERAWLLVGGPVPRGASAITVGPVVSIRRRFVDDERLVAHELVHVRQWRSLGAVGFLVRYVGSYLRWRFRGYPHWAAYRRIPLEVEASWEALVRVPPRR